MDWGEQLVSVGREQEEIEMMGQHLRTYNVKQMIISFFTGIIICFFYYNINPYQSLSECIITEEIAIIKSKSSFTDSDPYDLADRYCREKYFTIVYR